MSAKSFLLALGILCAAAPPAFAATTLTVDARVQPAAPETGYFHFGTATAPNGSSIGVNNRYLTLDGKPWLPVMGEMHFTRVPNRYWEEELAKMKMAGVDIVSTYIFWNHHEKIEGHFDWSGDRDLRRFVMLCAKLGLKVIIRPGPWVHSEARFGGIPDWVVNAVPARTNDPTYLKYVARYWGEVAKQTKGLLWKDGGPIIGMQLDNEYLASGPGQGPDHILALKRLALAAGFDLPFYTVTGWDGAVYPPREVTPLFGGYSDEPWGLSTEKNPPSETYAFRFETRVKGVADTSAPITPSDGDLDAPHTPFLGAEFGGGVPAMYRRRPIMQPDDVAAMLPVELGSGVNLYGYYMFHGGQNSPDHDAMQENTAIGAYNDLPMIDYDFQAPIGAYGQQHDVMGRIRPFHYFLQAFGSDLAPMMVHRPDVISKGMADLVTPRFSVRSLGDRGFLFFNNHVRQYPMAEQKAVQFAVQLPGRTLTFPAQPIDIPTDAYFILPINMNVAGANLVYATAQPVTRFEAGKTPVYVFHSLDGIATEFAFDAAGVASVTANSGTLSRDAATGRYVVSDMHGGTNAEIDIKLGNGGGVRVLVLTTAQADQLTLPKIGGQTHLLLTDAQIYADGDGFDLLSTGNPDFHFAVFPALAHRPGGSPAVKSAKPDGMFQAFDASAPPRHLSVTLTKIRDAGTVPPLVLGSPGNTAHEPAPEVFGKSAAWTIAIHGAVDDNDDALLRIRARGDIGRLFSGVTMLDDQFFNGNVWEVGLKHFTAEIKDPLMLTVLPLRKDSPIYLDAGVAKMVDGDQTAEVTDVSIVPQYRLHLTTNPPAAKH